ncbi:hypothetical protein BT69DRAFT_1279018 [Atractiella rhizophila]|nr:hypothetical protein BT69DRAFT_1279018 [Atractiella rhizophila]
MRKIQVAEESEMKRKSIDYLMARFQVREGRKRRAEQLIEERAGKAAEYPHQCPHCSVRAKRRSHLSTHIRIVHDDAISHLCSGCGQGFSMGSTVRKHQTWHTAPLECRSGRLVVAPKDQTKANWICSGCDTSFDLEDEYKHHRVESSSPACQTGRCFHIPSFEERMALYAKFRERMKDYHTCPKCSANFKEKGTLLRHYRWIHQRERMICTGCETVYSSLMSYWTHMRKSDDCKGTPWFYVPAPGPEDQVLCLCCGRISEGVTTFKSHKTDSDTCLNAQGYLIPAQGSASSGN